MTYHLHCKKCHHEWDSGEEDGICDWCGGGSICLAIIEPIDFSILLKKLIDLNLISKEGRDRDERKYELRKHSNNRSKRKKRRK